MVLSGIQPQAVRTVESKRPAEGLREGLRKPDETAAGVGTDSVAFQGRIESVETQRLVAERVLSRVESESLSGLSPVHARQSLQTAGQAQFLADLATQSDETATPETMAGQIVQGITGYIFKAFQTNNPNLDSSTFQGFQEQVLKGLDMGLNDARDILTGLQVMTTDLADSLAETGQSARRQLETFFTKTAESLWAANGDVAAGI
jgi:hypothetical protein